MWRAIVAIPLVILLSYVLFPDWEPRIRFAGLFLEILGLSTVAIGLRKTRKLFHQPSLRGLALKWVQDFPAFYRKTTIVAGSGKYTLRGGSSSFGISGTVAASGSLEDRIRVLERSLDLTNTSMRELQRKLDDETRKHSEALETESRDRKTEDERNQRLIEEGMAGGLHLETTGVFWLFIGMMLSTASREIAGLFVP